MVGWKEYSNARASDVPSYIVDVVREEDFYVPAHQAVFRAMRALSEKREPIDVCGETLHCWGLPLWVRRAIGAAMIRVAVGPLENYGLPRPDHRLFETHPIVNSQLLHHLAHGNIAAKPDVARFEDATVHFTDGSREEVDLVVFATGYRHEIPFLANALGAEGTAGLWGHMFAPAHPTLFVAGHFESDGGAYGLVSKQGALFAALAARPAARQALAARMRMRTPTPDLTGGIRHIDSPRHGIHVNMEAYGKFLRGLERVVGRRGAGTRGGD